MAEAVLEIVLNNLSSLIQKELGLFLGFKKDFKSLSSLITTIKATLQDAEEKQFTDNAIKDWLLKLKDAAFVLDDILDDCATNALELEHKGSKGGLTDKVRSSFLSSLNPKQVAFRYKIAKKMKSIRERLDEIAAERTKFHLTEIVREKRSGVLDWRQTTSISQPKVYGRDEDRNKIVDFLVEEAVGFEDLSVYPIVGLGGLGKTTLAQLIFNHERVVNHFKSRMWVCVSEDFSLKRMTKAIIEAATKKSCDDLDLEPLQRILQDLLQGERFLLVLDDVWDDKQENWKKLRSVLACGGKGSSILVTTRLAMVAEIMRTIPPHDISKLSDKDCWELFKERAFGPNEVEQEELVVIGKKILKKCGGVPLAAIALGSLLRFKREEKEWHYVKESKLWSSQDEDNVMPALRLSYLNLPVKLRQCFAFCAIFPKDEIINKQFLIELWMANGFISSNKMLDWEDIGTEVWNELYWRSFFQDFERDVFGKIISFKMHDLVHDLAQSISEEVCCITENDDMPDTLERIRHLSVNKNISASVDSIWMRNVKSLRTYARSYHYDVYYSPFKVFKFRSLHVLTVTLSDVPSSIGHLKCLSYLDLSGGSFETLPESICELWNLQILKLDTCLMLIKLPTNLIRLGALQHLSLYNCLNLSSLPPNIGKMTSLKTLSMYVVGWGSGYLLSELGQLNFKVDKLDITNLERVQSVNDAKEANMLSKHVNCLRLRWERNIVSLLQENVEQILEVLQPYPQQLQELWVEGYTGSHFPEWMSSPSLIHLRELNLERCKSCLHLPQLGNLPSLKELTIRGCTQIEGLDEALQHVTSLQWLMLEDFPNLTSFPDSIGNLSSLQELRIRVCPKLICLPASIQSLTSLKSLKIFNCPGLEKRCERETGEDWPKISHIQDVSVWNNLGT